MDEDEAFPRGGQATLSQLERREIARQAKKDVLFKDVSDAVLTLSRNTIIITGIGSASYYS